MKKLRYPLMIILSAVVYGIIPAFTKLTYAYGGTGMSVSFFMSLASLPFLLGVVKSQKVSLKVSAPILKKIVTLYLFGGSMAMLLLSFSYERLPVGMAVTLHFVYPVIVAFALVLLFKEKLNIYKIAALVVAVAGIAVMSLEEVNIDILGMVLAILSGFAYAFFIVYLDKSGLKEQNTYVLSFYAGLITAIIAGIVGFATGQIGPLTTPFAWVIVVFIGVIGRVVAAPCFQAGLRGTGALAAGILSTFEPITAVLVGILLLGEAATGGKIAGCLLVVLGVCLIVYSDVKEAKKQESVRQEAA